MRLWRRAGEAGREERTKRTRVREHVPQRPTMHPRMLQPLAELAWLFPGGRPVARSRRIGIIRAARTRRLLLREVGRKPARQAWLMAKRDRAPDRNIHQYLRTGSSGFRAANGQDRRASSQSRSRSSATRGCIAKPTVPPAHHGRRESDTTAESRRIPLGPEQGAPTSPEHRRCAPESRRPHR